MRFLLNNIHKNDFFWRYNWPKFFIVIDQYAVCYPNLTESEIWVRVKTIIDMGGP